MSKTAPKVAQKFTVGKEMPASVEKELGEYVPMVRTLLFHRGIETKDAAEKFLNPDYERDSSDPLLMLDMEKAAERILKAMEGGEKIIIYGDYDCDGIPGSVVLHDFFKKIGYANFGNYIPHRHNEGYGLNALALEKFSREGVNVVVTVDCGIVDYGPAEHAQSLGIDLIITDHHLPGEKLPEAFAVVNPKRPGDTYPDKMLCGAGVAFKLVQALLKTPVPLHLFRGGGWEGVGGVTNPTPALPSKEGREQTLREYLNIPKGWEKWLLDMAGLSTVADMVPLQNENRMIAHFGLKVLRKSPRVGLKKLLNKMRVDQTTLTEDDIGFSIAPRINAASRMDVPLRAFELLSTDDEETAEALATHLEKLNTERKGVVAGMIKEAKHVLSEREVGAVIVTGDPRWAPGLLGLAANSLVEAFGRPAFVWGKDEEGRIKGSCRSDGTVSVVELMSRTKEYFVQFGGHEASGGFMVAHEHVHILETKLSEMYEQMEKKPVEEGGIFVDAKLSLDDLNWKNYDEMTKLSPFGQGNPKPIFLFEDLRIEGVKEFGKTGTHLELLFKNSSGKQIKAIGFFRGSTHNGEELVAGQTVSLLAAIEKDTFRRFPELRLRVIEIL